MRMARSLAHCLVVTVALFFLVDASSARSAPLVDARAALLVDQHSGRVLFAAGAEKRSAVASLTKLMTAQVVLKEDRLAEQFPAVAYQAQVAESQIGLKPGELMSVRDLLTAMLLASANDAAATLAQGTAGSQRAFIRMMNSEARRLKLTDTHFRNPVGLDQAGNFSSAADLAKLTRLLLNNSFFRHTVALPNAKLGSGDRQRVVVNRNTLVGRYRFVKGVKTGHTVDALYCLVGDGRRDYLDLVSVVLGAPTEVARDSDTLELLRWGFNHFAAVPALKKGHSYGQTQVRYKQAVKLTVKKNAYVTVARGSTIKTVVSVPAEVEQTHKGKRVGQARVYSGGKLVGTAPLVATESIDAADGFRIFVYFLTLPLTLVVLLVIILTAGAFTVRHRTKVQ